MEIKNKTGYKYKIRNGEFEHYLNNDSSVSFNYEAGTKIELICLEKPYVHINWFDVILLQMFFGSTTLTRIFADYSFVVDDSSINSIELKYNDWPIREQININSCYANEEVLYEEYSLPQLKRVQKKHRRLHMFISNALPIGVGTLLACFLADPPYLFIFFFIIWLLAFELPALKEIKRFKQIMKPELLNEELCKYASKRRVEPLVFTDDTSKTSKFINKIFSKMFKFGDDK